MRLKRLKRKSKVKIFIKNITLATSLTSFTILMSTQFVDGTEALFVSTAKVTGETTSAFVFPNTTSEIIERIKKQIEGVQDILNDEYVVKELSDKQVFINQINETESIVIAIEKDFRLLESYYIEVKEKYGQDSTYQFVVDDYLEAEEVLKQIANIDEQKSLLMNSIDTQVNVLQANQQEEEQVPKDNQQESQPQVEEPQESISQESPKEEIPVEEVQEETVVEEPIEEEPVEEVIIQEPETIEEPTVEVDSEEIVEEEPPQLIEEGNE